MTPHDHLKALEERYACKAMNGEQIPEDALQRILEAARLAPTSSGLQPFSILVISNQELKEKLKPLAWNQPQITSCSHLLVFAAWDTYTEERINGMFDLTNEVRGFTNEGWEAYRQKLLSVYPGRDAQVNFEHAARQAYIALMAAMTQAAVEGIDSTPMEGFSPEGVDELLGLPAKGLRSAVILPLGYRDAENDWLVKLPKVRRPMEQFVEAID